MVFEPILSTPGHCWLGHKKRTNLGAGTYTTVPSSAITRKVRPYSEWRKDFLEIRRGKFGSTSSFWACLPVVETGIMLFIFYSNTYAVKFVLFVQWFLKLNIHHVHWWGNVFVPHCSVSTVKCRLGVPLGGPPPTWGRCCTSTGWWRRRTGARQARSRGWWPPPGTGWAHLQARRRRPWSKSIPVFANCATWNLPSCLFIFSHALVLLFLRELLHVQGLEVYVRPGVVLLDGGLDLKRLGSHRSQFALVVALKKRFRKNDFFNCGKTWCASPGPSPARPSTGWRARWRWSRSWRTGSRCI